MAFHGYCNVDSTPGTGITVVDYEFSGPAGAYNISAEVDFDDDVPGHSKFITAGSSSNWDWRDDNNDNRWHADPQENNPCPPGWRVPTKDELVAEHESWHSNNSAGA